MSDSKPKIRRGLLIGAGYFSDFHLDAWQRLLGAEIVCVCDLDAAKAKRAAHQFEVAASTTDLHTALQRKDLDFIDIATGPVGRLELIEQVAQRGLPIISQKPLAENYSTAAQIVGIVSRSASTLMVHENFRFQPWYREIKRWLDGGTIGNKLHSITMRTRLGDGWGADAYLSRQPYFRKMPRLLVQETGVHFVDTYRYLAGEIVQCSAKLRRLNDVIVGEDAAQLEFQFRSGATASWDANRYNETLADDPRFTFGELLVEADGGSLWLAADGQITIKPLGQSPTKHDYPLTRVGFAGDCVYRTQQHFLDVLNGAQCETSGREYLKTLKVVEALYESAERNRPVQLETTTVRRIVDLSLPVTPSMPGVQIAPCKTRPVDGWTTTTLTLYSHCGTHMDAPIHFLDDGATLDHQDLAACCGPARVVNITPVEPKMLIGIKHVTDALGQLFPGDRLLFRTDWYLRFGTPQYRNDLPRISIELARWLVAQQVALIGIEQLSVADVNNLAEVTEVHQTLFRGGVVIVEALAHLDQLTRNDVEFIALPLKIIGGDGCPVRAIAIEEHEVLR